MTGLAKWIAGGIAVCFLFIGLWFLGWQHTARLERELAEAKSTLEDLHIDHRDTMDAINRAIDAREAINEQARIRAERLRKTLRNDPLADTPISDELRLRLQWQQDDICEIPAAGEPASGCADTGPLKAEDGR